jgi:hypothetical protein
VFADGDEEPEYEPLPPITREAGSLVPIVLIGMAVGGGAAALLFHERLVRLLFGG